MEDKELRGSIVSIFNFSLGAACCLSYRTSNWIPPHCQWLNDRLSFNVLIFPPVSLILDAPYFLSCPFSLPFFILPLPHFSFPVHSLCSYSLVSWPICASFSEIKHLVLGFQLLPSSSWLWSSLFFPPIFTFIFSSTHSLDLSLVRLITAPLLTPFTHYQSHYRVQR